MRSSDHPSIRYEGTTASQLLAQKPGLDESGLPGMGSEASGMTSDYPV